MNARLEGAARPGGVARAALRRLRHVPPRGCVAEGLRREELLEALNVALVVGGSITIPHLRRAVESLDLLLAER